jgi:hypothetical protein
MKRASAEQTYRQVVRGALALFLILSAAGAALARTLTIQSFKAEVIVMPDGTVDVTETIVAHFAGTWNGLYRTVPIEYETPQHLNYSLFLTPISATDDTGNNLKYETSSAKGYLKFKIYVPGATDVTRTIVLHYRVSDALRFFEDHDELYWNITGNDWDVPIQSASAEIALPGGTTGAHALAFTGSYGSQSQDARVETSGTLIRVQMERELSFREGVTVVAGWDKGFVREPSSSEYVWRFMRSNWPLFIPFFVFFGMFYVWFTRGRDPRRRAIAVQYEPPDGLSPGELGTLVDNTAAMRDVMATLVDLAVRGYLTIEEKQTEHMMGLFSNKTYTFHLKKPLSDWAGLKPHELQLLAGIFTNGVIPDVSLSDLQNSFYKNLPPIKNAMLDSLMEHHYYLHRPDNVRGVWIGIGFVTGALMIFGGNALASMSGMSVAPFAISAVVTGAIICGFGLVMRAHTSEGLRAVEAALGFEDFLQHVEVDRINRMEKTPALFEKFLPYAMALGIEKKWVSAFGDICKTPPQWYQGGVYGSNFYMMGFVHDLNAMSVQASAAMASAPRSAGGGSGFGGGGGSGGGFGGGGGGGF